MSGGLNGRPDSDHAAANRSVSLCFAMRLCGGEGPHHLWGGDVRCEVDAMFADESPEMVAIG